MSSPGRRNPHLLWQPFGMGASGAPSSSSRGDAPGPVVRERGGLPGKWAHLLSGEQPRPVRAHRFCLSGRTWACPDGPADGRGCCFQAARRLWGDAARGVHPRPTRPCCPRGRPHAIPVSASPGPPCFSSAGNRRPLPGCNDSRWGLMAS